MRFIAYAAIIATASSVILSERDQDQLAQVSIQSFAEPSAEPAADKKGSGGGDEKAGKNSGGDKKGSGHGDEKGGRSSG